MASTSHQSWHNLGGESSEKPQGSPWDWGDGRVESRMVDTASQLLFCLSLLELLVPGLRNEMVLEMQESSNFFFFKSCFL